MAKLEKRPYRSQLFDMYLHWKSLPSIYRGNSAEVIERIGIDDSVGLELLNIKTHAEFAKRFEIDPGTLSDWNKRIDKEDLLAPFRSENLKKVVMNVVGSLAAAQTKKPTPSGAKVLYDIAFKNEKVRKENISEDEEESETYINGKRWVKKQWNSTIQNQIKRVIDAAYGDEEPLPRVEPKKRSEKLDTALETIKNLKKQN